MHFHTWSWTLADEFSRVADAMASERLDEGRIVVENGLRGVTAWTKRAESAKVLTGAPRRSQKKPSKPLQYVQKSSIKGILCSTDPVSGEEDD